MITKTPHPDVLVTNLEFEITRRLTVILDNNGSWKLVAEGFNTYYGIFSACDIRTFQSKSSPSEILLHELENRLCTVGILCEILTRCQLYEALALLRDPERVVITQQPGDSEDTIYIPEGSDLQLECRAFGLPPPRYIWYLGNEELRDQTSSILIVRDFSVQHEGEYYCCISQDTEDSDLYQVYSHRVNVELLPVPPTIHEQPVPYVVCREGDVITLSCIATGHPEPQYEWFKENFQLPGEKSNTLTISDITPSSEGSYRCYVKNKSGAVWSNQSNLSLIRFYPGGEECRPRITATEKVALLIGNDKYTELSDLNTPSNDVATIAAILKDIGFKVLALHNLTLNEMRNAVREFCQLLPEGGYGFFYFVGHGFEIQDKFMLPVDAPGCNKYRRCNSLCEKEVIQDVMEVMPRLFLILLDMCLKIPSRNENPDIHEELPKVFPCKPQRNLIQQYATTSNLGAYERSTEVNGIYVNHLKKHLAKDINILEILKMVQKEIATESPDAADKQMPYISSNVVEDFYLTDTVTGHPQTETRFHKLMALPAVDAIVFDNVGWKSQVKIQPHRDCFHNTLDIYITNMKRWAVVCRMACEKLELELHREEDVLLITIHKLQKTKMPIVLSVTLKDPITRKEVGSYTFDLEQPLITQAHLWFNCSRHSSP